MFLWEATTKNRRIVAAKAVVTVTAVVTAVIVNDGWEATTKFGG